ncbi:MAG: hypothetical protein HY657_18790 [Acidobacteria bacterium]|nr:hypothetical protein [Acidobacteriota bacterium]
MLDWDERQRAVLIETLREAANIVFAGLVVGLFLSEGRFSLALAFTGAVVWVPVLGANIWLAKSRRPWKAK